MSLRCPFVFESRNDFSDCGLKFWNDPDLIRIYEGMHRIAIVQRELVVANGAIISIALIANEAVEKYISVFLSVYLFVIWIWRSFVYLIAERPASRR
jgi:hypothetical protein